MSQRNYVIICDGRINLLAAGSKAEKIKAASNVATLFAVVNNISAEDAKPISDIQHYLMDNFKGISAATLKSKTDELLEYLDALEDKYE